MADGDTIAETAAAAAANAAAETAETIASVQDAAEDAVEAANERVEQAEAVAEAIAEAALETEIVRRLNQATEEFNTWRVDHESRNQSQFLELQAEITALRESIESLRAIVIKPASEMTEQSPSILEQSAPNDQPETIVAEVVTRPVEVVGAAAQEVVETRPVRRNRWL